MAIESLLRFLVRAEARDFKRTASEIKKAIVGMGDSAGKAGKTGKAGMDRFGASIISVGNLVSGLAITFLGFEVVNAIRQWTREVIEFEREFANVTTLVDTSEVSADVLRRGILGLSTQLGSATDLTRGLYQTLSAGVAPAQAIEFIATSAKFATAALTDTFTAVDVLTTVVNAYGLSAEQASVVSDQLFQIIKDGKTQGPELAASLGRVIPTAATLGVDLQEVGAALATMTKGGINTNEAVTSLNQALLSFLKPQEKAKKLAREMGIELNADAIASKGFAQALSDLAEKSQGNSEATAVFFGNIRALKAVLALTGTQAEEFDRILANMANTAGNTNEAFEKQTETIGFQLEALWNNMSKQFINATANGGAVARILKSVNKVLDDNASIIRDVAIPPWIKLFTFVENSLNSFVKIRKELEKEVKIIDRAAIEEQKFADALARKVKIVERTGTVLGRLGKKTRELTEEEKALAKHVEKVTEEFNKKLKPTEELADKIEILTKKGFDLDDILKIYGDDLVEAALRQSELGQEVDDSVQKWVNSAGATQKMKDELEKLNGELKEALEKVPSLTKDILKLGDSMKVAEPPMDTLRRNLANYVDDMKKATDGTVDLSGAANKMAAVLADLSGKPKDIAEQIELLNQRGIPAAQQVELLSNALEEAENAAKAFGLELPESIKELIRLRDETKKSEDAAKDWNKVWANAMGKIVADFAEGIGEIITSMKGFGDGLKRIAQEIGRTFVKTMIVNLFEPLQKEFENFGKSINKFLKESIGGVFKNIGGGEGLTGLTALLAPLGLVGGGAALGSNFGVEGALLGGAAGFTAAGFLGILGPLAAAGPFAAPVAAAIAAFLGIKNLFTNTPLEAGVKEAARDFGIDISETIIEEFTRGIGVSEKDFAPARKSILSSPAFIENLVRIGELTEANFSVIVDKFKQFEAFGRTFDLSAPLKIALDTGNFEAYNEAWLEIFGTSSLLQEQFGVNFPFALLGTTEALEGVVQSFEDFPNRTEDALNTLDEFLDSFRETGVIGADFEAFIGRFGGNMEAFKAALKIPELEEIRSGFERIKAEVDSFLPKGSDAVGLFLQTGEITDELAAKILAAGGNIEDFKEFANLRDTKANFQELIDKWQEGGVVSQELLNHIKQFAPESADAFLQLTNNLASSSDNLLGRITGANQLTLASIQQIVADNEEAAALLEAAMSSAGDNIETKFLEVASALSGALGTMINEVSSAIDRLTSELTTAIDALKDAIREANGVPSPLTREEILASLTPEQRQAHFQALLKGNPSPIPGLQHGGIVTRPTVSLIGESGPEAVIPLNKRGAFGNITVIVQGDVIGVDSFEEKVSKVLRNRLDAGGFPNLART